MRQEYLSNDRTELDEPKLYTHRCCQCGAIYNSFNSEDGICGICLDIYEYGMEES